MIVAQGVGDDPDDVHVVAISHPVRHTETRKSHDANPQKAVSKKPFRTRKAQDCTKIPARPWTAPTTTGYAEVVGDLAEAASVSLGFALRHLVHYEDHCEVGQNQVMKRSTAPANVYIVGNFYLLQLEIHRFLLNDLPHLIAFLERSHVNLVPGPIRRHPLSSLVHWLLIPPGFEKAMTAPGVVPFKGRNSLSEEVCRTVLARD